METLRTVGQFSLNEGGLAASGLYNVTNQILLNHTEEQGASPWFDPDLKDKLMSLSDFDFVQRCKSLAGNDIYSYEVGKSIWEEITNLPTNEKNQITKTWKPDVGGHFFEGDSISNIVDWFLKTFRKNQ